jgi:hypothetical protein
MPLSGLVKNAKRSQFGLVAEVAQAMPANSLWRRRSIDFLVFWLFAPPLFQFMEVTLFIALPDVLKYRSVYFRTEFLLEDDSSIAIYSVFDHYVFGLFGFILSSPVWYLAALVPTALLLTGLEVAARYGERRRYVSAFVLGAIVAEVFSFVVWLLFPSDGDSGGVDFKLAAGIAFSGAFSSIGALWLRLRFSQLLARVSELMTSPT